MDIVFLPATAPNEASFGSPPTRLEDHPDLGIHTVHFDTMVWYNDEVRRRAIDQIRGFGDGPFVLAGFSKSGLGAWNITREIPDRVSGTLIFDAPVAQEVAPPWGTEPFYENNGAWQRDLPLLSVEAYRSAVPDAHPLVLISGEYFHDEMELFSRTLDEASVPHTFLSRPEYKHGWDGGWIDEGLDAVAAGTAG